MNRLYPRTKWSGIMSGIQVGSILSKALEVRDALCCEDIVRLDEEISDLEHSIQTYWGCREREGVDVDAIRAAVIEKNRKRGYYDV